MAFLLGYGQGEAVLTLLIQTPPTLAYHLLLIVPVHFVILRLKRRLEKI